MKRTLKQIGSLFLMVCMAVTMLPGAVFAAVDDEFIVDNLKYKVLTEDTGAKTGTVALVGYPYGSEPTGTLIVAETVSNGGIDYTVTEIGEEAFSWCSGLTDVIISNSVETVGENAFESITDLSNVTLGSSVKTIGDGAFKYLKMTDIHLTESVEVIGEDAFYGCENLTEFTVDEVNSNFSAKDGVLYSKDGKTLVLYPMGKTGDSYTIPDSVVNIGKRAFNGNNKIQTMDTANVVTIGEEAFEGSGLESINIRDSVVTIGLEAFKNCPSLVTVTIPASSSLETIGVEAFSQCLELMSINLPASLKTIGGWAFGYCDSLESLWIGPLVESIGTDTFVAEKLADFTVAPDNEYYTSADSVLYDKSKTILIKYMQGKTDTSFSIPDTVTKIEESAFYSSNNLESVTIPSSVNSIGNSAFYWSEIKSVAFLGNIPPTVGSGIFNSCMNLTDIYVPKGSGDAYKTALGDYASLIRAPLTIDQAAWEALIAVNGAAINDGDTIILGEDVTGDLYRSDALSNLTIDGNGHTINGCLYFSKKINLTLENVTINGSNVSHAITFIGISEESRLKTLGTVTVKGKDSENSSSNGKAGIYSVGDLTITASDTTTITAGDTFEDGVSYPAVLVENGTLTLDGGSPTFHGGKSGSSNGVYVGSMSDNDFNLIIISGSPKFIGGSINDIGTSGAVVEGTIRISSSGSPQFIGSDGLGSSNRANGAWALNLEITAGTPIFIGGSATSDTNYSFAGNGIDVDTVTISGIASPTFTGGDAAASDHGGRGLLFWEGLNISTSRDVTFTGGSNSPYAIEEGNGSATKNGINLKNLTGKITADNTKGEYSAIGLIEGTITYPEELTEAQKYNGTDKMYTLDMGATYTVTVNGSYEGTTGAGSYAHGSTVTISAGSRSNYSFAGWTATDITLANPDSASTTFTMPANNVTVTANWKSNSSSGDGGDGGDGGGSGGSGGGGAIVQPTAPAANGSTQVNYTASGGTASLALPNAKVDEIITNSKGDEAVIDLSEVSGITSAELPKTAVSAMNQAGLDVTVRLPAGSITLNEGAAASILEQAEGGSLKLELQQVASTSLTDEQKKAVKSGDLVLDINILSGTKKISTFDGTLTISVPYNGPQPVAVWYLNDKGELEKLSCTFEDGKVSFDLDHLSLYVVGQDTAWVNPFTDIKETEWFYNSVEYVHENGLMVGTSTVPMRFSPHDATIRAMLVTILYRLEGSPEVTAANVFSDVKDEAYYAKAVVWASENKIVSGYGDSKFGPLDILTREQMASIMFRYAKYKGYNVTGGADLSSFDDAEAISAWAKEALAWSYDKGLILGNGKKLAPDGNAERCHTAAILQRFIESIAKEQP